MSETETSPAKPPKERSPSFPAITLTKALEKVAALYVAAKRHEMRIENVASAWGTGAKSSGTQQAIAALIAFGLVEDSGAGDARKFKVTDLAFKALEDQRPGAKEAALAQAALMPKLIAEYAEKWRDGRPADGICTSELRIDRGFTDDGARAFLKVFDDTLRYAKVASADKSADTQYDKIDPSLTLAEPIAVGDLVEIEVGGSLIQDKPVKVRAIQEHEGQRYIFVAGSEAGVLMSDATLVEKASPDATPPILPLPRVDPLEEEGDLKGMELDRFTVDEGVVKIAFPPGMSAASVEELEQFFSLFIKKAKRRAAAT
jgi:hypothetical protein